MLIVMRVFSSRKRLIAGLIVATVILSMISFSIWPLATAFLLSYYGYWYLQIIPHHFNRYFMVRHTVYIALSGISSVIGVYMVLLPSYSTRIRGATIASDMAGIPFYLIIILTFVIIFVIAIVGLLIGSSFNKNSS